MDLPCAFIGHGSPMNAIEQNRYTEAWKRFGASVPQPRAILVISAHWYIHATAVTVMAKPRTIHDFFGFPTALSTFEYPAPGAPDVAAELVEVVKPQWVGLDDDSWGIDHGAWSVLAHSFPAADIPVIQLSVNGMQPLEYHLNLGAALAPLRQRGVLIVASGNVVHNLAAADRSRPDLGFSWAERFDESVRSMVIDSPEDALRLAEHSDFDLAAPTPDHFIPLLYLAGLSMAGPSRPEILTEGFSYGALSMASYTLDSTDYTGSRGPLENDPGRSSPEPVGPTQPATAVNFDS
ncbi:MAG: 4,5-DOPA dioxygenase extradiol [Acidimicrobiales bacterium]